MSSYINIFIRNKDTLIPIGDFSRSNEIYQKLNNIVPYEKLCPISKHIIEDLITDVYKEIDNIKKNIAKLQDKIKIIPTYNNSISEKELLICDYRNEIEDCNQDIEDKLFAVGILQCYICMIEAVQYNDDMKVDVDRYIYAGIEVPNNITKDIILTTPV